MLLRLDSCLEHPGMFEGRRGNNDGVEIGTQHLLEILVDGWLLELQLGGCHFNTVAEEIAECGYFCARVGVDNTGIIGAAATRTNQPNGDFGVRLGAAYRLRADDGKRGGRSRAAYEIAPGNRGVRIRLH